MAGIHVPRDVAAELLVVDNGSSDHTLQVVEETATGALAKRYVLESRAGQCHARNRGLAEATGDVILFTDDDVRPPERWIEEMCRPIVTRGAELVQGGIRPASHLAKTWLVGAFAAVSAAVEPSTTDRAPDALIGANMAFSRVVLNAVKGFDPLFGPGACGFCDDILFGSMALAAGFRSVYARDAAVLHHFDASRLEPPALVDCARRLGRSFALFHYHWAHDEGRYSIRRYLGLRIKLAARKLLPHLPSVGPLPQWRFCYERDLAYLRQYRQLMGSPRRYPRRSYPAITN
jgi:glycosyltransferase involved in cell wall biosynthesis